MCFDEKKTWEWTSSSSEEEKPGTLVISFGQYGNRGVRKDEDKEETEEGNDETVEIEHNLPDNSNDDVTETSELRRSTRVSKKPGYLDDYVCLAEEEGERLLLLINEEPWDFRTVVEEKVWRDACEEEISSIFRNKTWDLVELPPGAKAIGLKWIFKIKRNSDGSIININPGFLQRDISKGMGLIPKKYLLQ